MKELNLSRLLDCCCVEISDELYDGLMDYLLNIDIDLNELNVDDLVVNGISVIYNEEVTDDVIVIAEENGISYILS